MLPTWLLMFRLALWAQFPLFPELGSDKLFRASRQASEARLSSANAMLAGERGVGRLRRLKRSLVARRARMVAQLGAALGLGFHTGKTKPCTVSNPLNLYSFLMFHSPAVSRRLRTPTADVSSRETHGADGTDTAMKLLCILTWLLRQLGQLAAPSCLEVSSPDKFLHTALLQLSSTMHPATDLVLLLLIFNLAGRRLYFSGCTCAVAYWSLNAPS